MAVEKSHLLRTYVFSATRQSHRIKDNHCGNRSLRQISNLAWAQLGSFRGAGPTNGDAPRADGSDHVMGPRGIRHWQQSTMGILAFSAEILHQKVQVSLGFGITGHLRGRCVRFIRATGNRSGVSCGLVSAARFTVSRSTSSRVPPRAVFQVLTSAHV